MQKPSELIDLENVLQIICKTSKKSTQQIASSIIHSNIENINELKKILDTIVKKIQLCRECGIVSSKPLCDICSDNKREQILMIVINSSDVWRIEDMNVYRGKYHVLGYELVSSKDLNDKNSNLNIFNLIDRVKNFDEIIISTNPTISGETTAQFIIKILANFKSKISRLAIGIPLGAKIDYIDGLTFKSALKNRIKENDE